MGLPISLILFFCSEYIFSLIFGESWVMAGLYVKYLTPAFFIRFIVSPLSPVLLVKNKIKLLSIWKTIYFLTTTITLWVCCIYASIDYAIIIYAIHEVILYTIYLIIQIKSL